MGGVGWGGDRHVMLLYVPLEEGGGEVEVRKVILRGGIAPNSNMLLDYFFSFLPLLFPFFSSSIFPFIPSSTISLHPFFYYFLSFLLLLFPFIPSSTISFHSFLYYFLYPFLYNFLSFLNFSLNISHFRPSLSSISLISSINYSIFIAE